MPDALTKLRNRFSFTPRVVTVPVQNSLGRITAEAIISPLTVPAAHLSAIDGIAAKSRDTIGATDKSPVTLTDCVRVHTGNVIPGGFDAVMMLEDGEENDGLFQIHTPAHPWQHVRPIGEDIARTGMIIPRLTRIRAVDIGAMANYGISEVPVLDLKVALISTGSEIVPVGSMPHPGQVIESNMHMAAAIITAVGASITHFSIVPDDRDQIRAMVEGALMNHDIVLISAGTSTGLDDYTKQIIADLGEVFIHGVAIKPAKSVILGRINNKPVIGIPGYPVACYTILREIILPVLGWYGFFIPKPDVISVHLTNGIQSSIGFDEFILAAVGKIQDTWVAEPIIQGSGVQMSMVRSNAYLKIPADQGRLKTGSKTDAVLTVPRSTAEQMVLVTGSHDPAIDYLADLVRESGIFLTSSHVGSMGGLLALKRGHCHLAPMHLLDEDGEYNIAHLQKHLPGKDLILICVAERVQGVVSRDVLGFDDIIDHRFINRQRGSGTRMLLDRLLTQKGILPDDITGYDQEVSTHLEVCLAVQNGDADIGMTIYGAAHAFSLPFIPVGVERYELVTTRQMFEEDPRIGAIAEMITTQKFKEVLIHLGGYEMENTGTIRRLNKKKSIRSSIKK